jgi:hypothetical protein
MKVLRRIGVRFALGLAAIFARPTPAAVGEPIAEKNYDSRLDVTVTVQAGHTAPVPAELLAAYHRQAEEYWAEFYRDLPAELAAHTRRAMARRPCGW